MKIAPRYSCPVIHVLDASRSVVVVSTSTFFLSVFLLAQEQMSLEKDCTKSPIKTKFKKLALGGNPLKIHNKNLLLCGQSITGHHASLKSELQPTNRGE